MQSFEYFQVEKEQVRNACEIFEKYCCEAEDTN